MKAGRRLTPLLLLLLGLTALLGLGTGDWGGGVLFAAAASSLV